MTCRLSIRAEAEAELAGAFDWYERRVSGLGADLLAAVDAAVDSILSNPFQHPVVYRSVRRIQTRRFPYQVLFLVEGDLVTETRRSQRSQSIQKPPRARRQENRRRRPSPIINLRAPGRSPPLAPFPFKWARRKKMAWLEASGGITRPLT
jgi:toxin ParE1/3/4